MTSGIVLPGDYGEAGQSMTRCYREARTQSRSGILAGNTDVVQKFAESFLMFDPGSSVHYGLSADVLAAVIEVITAKKYSEFLKDELFPMLNMTETDFCIDGSKLFRQIPLMGKPDMKGRISRADASVAARYGIEDPASPPWYESGGIGLYSTMEDYVHFCEMLVNRGTFHGKELIGRRTFAYMTSDQLNDTQRAALNNSGYGYGCYFNVLRDPCTAATAASKGSVSCWGEMGTYFCVDVEEGLILLIMSQQDGGLSPSFVRGLRQIIYGAM
jgi:CubicO group peptidase (beta-lactamase class C family)